VLVHGGKLLGDVGTFRLTETCPDYCQAGTAAACGPTLEIISRVRFGAIDNSTPTCVLGGYQNFMNQVATQSKLCPDQIIVDTANPNSADNVSVFVDWNQDFDFNDLGESITLSGSPLALPTQFTGMITPPLGALLGNTRMRVALNRNATVSACGVLTFANYEDYTVSVLPLFDTDGDGSPDCVDGCPSDPGKVAPGVCGCGTPDTDSDGDGTPNCVDGCPNDPLKVGPGFCGCGTSDVDTDGDGTPDCNDGCENDPTKLDPGVCGCGVPDTDDDGDGFPNCVDACPTDPNKVSPGACGCGAPETDFDGDGIPNCIDNCIAVPNHDQLDSDFDGHGDLCDNCPLNANPTQLDCDNNGRGDVCEIAGGFQPDCQLNGIPDNCDPDCNTNGIPDDCDITGGSSQDLNSNGLPDECEGPGVQFCFGNGTGTSCPCGNVSAGSGKGCLNSTNRGAILYNSGLASVSNDSSRLTAIQLPGNKTTIFFMGNQQVNGGLGIHFYDGLLCLSAVRRYPVQVSSAQGQIDIVQVVGLSNGLITAGSTWFFQAWYRDPTGPCLQSANLTNGLGITFTP
jgi:hypothetical protein